MKQTYYAVCHLQKGSGNDAGMSCHIERKDANGKRYVPENADANRTQLNRELIKFPDGVTRRTHAIAHRIASAGLSRTVAKNQVQAIRIVLTGTHERMTELERTGNLNAWINANMEWLRNTFGNENLVSCVLHMDEKTPHLHATIVPIVAAPRKRREREGEQKYKTKEGPRLSASDLMTRGKLREYQDTYGKAMSKFGLERGIVGSTADHLSRQQFNAKTIREQEKKIASLQENIELLQTEARAAANQVEDAKANVKAKVLSWVGGGELTKARKETAEKDKKIAALQQQLIEANKILADMKSANAHQIAALKDGYKREVNAAIARAERAEAALAEKNNIIDCLDRKANPQRYCLSSGARLVNCIIPNLMGHNIHIVTAVGDVVHHAYNYDMPYDLAQAYDSGKMTKYELINAIFGPQEQINQEQASLLGITLELLSGGPATPQIGTGSGGETGNESRWDGKTANDFRPKRR